MKLSEKIIHLRKKNGMSQEDLANELKVSRQTVSRWEVGTVLPDALNILNLSKLFNVTADYLLNDEYEEEFSIKSKMSSRKKQCIVGYVCFGLATIWSFILGILSLINPVVHEVYDMSGHAIIYKGILAYVMVYDAQWIVGVIIMLILIGMMLIFHPKIIAILKKAKDKGIVF